ncbi:MAG TPA: protein kinase [Noviherbaspirillum sp.]
MSTNMASLTHAIRSFQNGGLSHHEFFAQVDRVLASDQGNSAHLLEILGDEHTRVQLPPDVFAELQRRVEHVTASRNGMTANDPSLHTNDDRRYTTRSGSSTMYGEPPQEAYRMKGVGETLNGRFVLEECIGFGGMGTVYKALDLRKLEASDRNPYVAIKVLNVQFRGHPKSLIALQREAKKAQTLAHPNIVSVYDFDRDGATVYLTMEYLSGKPLSRTLRTPGFSGLPFPEVMRIVTGMGKALAYAHERGFVHCDFKPANVILTDNGQVKVIDFGIARVFQKADEDVEATVFDPGSLGALTPAYASPEMLEHLVPDPRDDIYALACITYELLTGRHPFDRQSATQARHAGMKAQRPKNLGYMQWRALRNALSFERKTRTPSVARFLKEMQGAGRTVAYAAWGGGVVLAAGLVAVAASYYQGAPAPSDTEASASAAPPAPDPQPPAQASVPPAPQTAAPPPAAPKLTMAAVAPVLAGIPCSALLPDVRGDTIEVKGYIPRRLGTARLKEMLAAIPGANTVNASVQQVSDEKCGVIEMLAPYWARTRQAGDAATIRTQKKSAELVEGEYLVLDITTPPYDTYVNVDYFAFDGSVVHLVPSFRAKDNQAPPSYAATIGSLGNWMVSKPFGTDFIVFLATPAPLFDGLRPESESASDYLGAVGKQLAQLSAKHGADKIAVDFLQITTRARKP